MDILKKLGAKFSKVGVTENDYVLKNDPTLNKMDEDRKVIAKKYAQEFAEHVSKVISKEQFEFLSRHHNYADIRFGSRRVARVINYAKGIMDYEVNHPEPSLDKGQFNWALDFIILAGFFHLLPGTFVLYGDDYNEKAESVIQQLIQMMELQLSESEYQLLIDASFHAKTLPAGSHIIIDVMHDAMVIDDQYFDGAIAENLLRCRASKQVAFINWTKKVSIKNLSPSWVTYLQEIWGVDNFSLVTDRNIEEYAREVDRDDML